MTTSRIDSLPRFDTLLLASISAIVLAVVRIAAAWHRGPVLAWFVCEMAMAIGLWCLVRNRQSIREAAYRYLTVTVVAAACFPFVREWLTRWLGGHGAAPEITLLVSMQMISLVLAAFSFQPRMAGASVLLGAFLLLFTTTMTTSVLAYVLTGLYGVLSLWWLMGAYWSRIEGAFTAANVRRHIPVRGAVVGICGLVVLLLVGIVGVTSATTHVLQGFLPTSGGNRWEDKFAQSGVGDGDAMVAAKDQAMSFGPVDSDLFLDSEMPTLYDMFDDTYGEPPMPKKNERAVSLEYQEREDVHHRIAKTQRSGREFSAVRRRAKQQHRHLADRDSPAMLYVVGRTPLHLALETYDFFDGRTWRHRTNWQEPHVLEMKSRLGKPWLTARKRRRDAIYQRSDCYGVKVINLKTNRIPSPPHLTELHIDKIDRGDFFGWTNDGMIEMRGREKIPQLTVIHLHASRLSLHSLRTSWKAYNVLDAEQQTTVAPYLQCSAEHGEVAAEWTAGVPRGWLQVEAVVNRLRGFDHAPDATVPEDCSDVVAYFLDTKQGPDYLFATTAAQLLRSLGYPTRLVSGFYADPKRYDRRAGQTDVLAEDVHVWAEVCVGDRWVTIEPTPGYQAPSEHLTAGQFATLIFWRLASWCRRNVLAILLTSLACVVLVIFRRVCLDWAGWSVCQLLGSRSPQTRLVWTIRLLEWRAWLAGRARSPAKSITRWYRPLIDSAPNERRAALTSFFRWSDRLLYSRRRCDRADPSEIQRACAAVVSTFQLKFITDTLPVPAAAHPRHDHN